MVNTDQQITGFIRILVVFVALCLSACSLRMPDSRLAQSIDQPINIETSHQRSRAPARIKTVVIHYTAETLPASLSLLSGDRVSVHYLIPESPMAGQRKMTVWQLVSEDQVAWHAGSSFWRGATRINDTSVGIELVNAGYQQTLTGGRWAPYAPAQISALQTLVRGIVQRYGINPQNIVAHSDIAPQRKRDPGPLFPWQALARSGIGVWPDEKHVRARLGNRAPNASVPASQLLDVLARYGYEVTPEMTPAQQRNVIAAFQMHFRPADYRGLPDAESLAIAETLAELATQ